MLDDDWMGWHDHGFIHEDEIPNLEHTREHVEALLDAVYHTGDINTIEERLEELAAQFEIQYTLKPTKIRRGLNGRAD